jgi:hypothetical protein
LKNEKYERKEKGEKERETFDKLTQIPNSLRTCGEE